VSNPESPVSIAFMSIAEQVKTIIETQSITIVNQEEAVPMKVNEEGED